MAGKNIGTLTAQVAIETSGAQQSVSKLTSAWNAYSAAQKAALSPSAQPGLISSIGDAQMAQIQKAIDLRKRFEAGGNADFIGPVPVMPREVETEAIRLIEQRKEAAIRAVQARKQAEISANAVIQQSQLEEAATFEAAQEQKIRVTQRITQAMALQRQQALALFTAPVESKISASTSMFAQQTARATVETKKLWAAQVQAKVAANSLAYSLGASPASAAGAMRRLGNTTDDSLKGFARFNLGIQNSAYQIQDLAVQLASGQSAVVAFSQQLPQLTSGFGGKLGFYGAIVGVGIALAGLSYKLISARSGTAAAKEEAEKARDAFLKMRDAISSVEGVRLGSAGVRSRDLAKARKDEADATTDLALRESRLADVRKKLDEVAPVNKFTGTRDIPFVGRGAVKDLLEREKLLEEAITKQKTKQAESAETVLRLEGEIAEETVRRAQSATEAYLEQEDAIRSLREQIEDFDRTDTERLDAINREMAAMRQLGEVGSAEYLRLELAAKRVGRKILEQDVAGLIHDIYGNPDKTAEIIRGLQTRMPQQLQINTGASALGGVAGGGPAQQTLEIQRSMLDAIRQLVMIARMDAMGSGVN